MAWMSRARVVRDVERACEAELREAVKAARASAVRCGSVGVVVVVEVGMGVGVWVVIAILEERLAGG